MFVEAMTPPFSFSFWIFVKYNTTVGGRAMSVTLQSFLWMSADASLSLLLLCSILQTNASPLPDRFFARIRMLAVFIFVKFLYLQFCMQRVRVCLCTSMYSRLYAISLS